VIRYVIDASVAAEYLLRTGLGLRITDLIEGAFLIAPELLDVEVLSMLRRAVLHKKLETHRAGLALEDLVDWPIERISHTALVQEAWQYRNNVSAYDAFYVAAARIYDIPLLTADGPLARAPSMPSILVQNVRMA
jgi:predicted nucleic acid-binding protein